MKFVKILNIFLYTFLLENIISIFGLENELSISNYRDEVINSKVCYDLFENNHDLCSTNYINETISWRNCRCDEFCKYFGDCCADRVNNRSEFFANNLNHNQIDYHHIHLHLFNRKNHLWQCLPLNYAEYSINAYMIDKCKKDYQGSIIEQFCTQSNKKVNYLNFQSTIPVHSQKTMLLYKNIFCAQCNNDAKNLTKWTINFHCSQNIHLYNLTSDQLRNYLNSQTFVENKKFFKFKVKDIIVLCKLKINEFGNHSELAKIYKIRTCYTNYNQCPDNYENKTVARKCESFASYMFERKARSDQKTVGYKNFFCFKCNNNNSDASLLTCDKPAAVRVTTSRSPSFTMLFDFNYNIRGNHINKQVNECDLNLGYLFDTIKGKCRKIFCGKLYLYDEKTRKCLQGKLFKTQMKTNCTRIILYKDEFYRFNNGTIKINRNSLHLAPNEYEELNYNMADKKSSDIETYKDKIVVCADRYHFITTVNYTSLQYYLTMITLSISSVCLILNLIVYSMIPNFRNLPGKNLSALSFTILIANLFFILSSNLKNKYYINEFDENEDDYKSFYSFVCIATSIGLHFVYLTAFVWMNIMAFDLWVTFTDSKSNLRRLKFWRNSLYSCIMPTVIVLISCAFDISFKKTDYQPMYGYTVCWISQRKALLIFFILPIVILMIINLILFWLTIRSLVKTERQTRLVKNYKENKSRLLLYIKLFIVMGLTWIFGFIAALIDNEIFWLIFILLNGSQGAFIFISFSCKQNTYKLIKQRFKSSTSSNLIRRSEDTNTKSSTLLLNQLTVANKVSSSNESLATAQ